MKKVIWSVALAFAASAAMADEAFTFVNDGDYGYSYIQINEDLASFKFKSDWHSLGNDGVVDLGARQAGDRIGFYEVRPNGGTYTQSAFKEWKDPIWLAFDKNGGSGKDEWMTIDDITAQSANGATPPPSGAPLPGVREDCIIYINTEEPALRHVRASEEIIANLKTQLPPDNQPSLLFVDEPASFPDYEKGFGELLRMRDIDIYVSISSRRLLNEGLAPYLNGYVVLHELLPPPEGIPESDDRSRARWNEDSEEILKTGYRVFFKDPALCTARFGPAPTDEAARADMNRRWLMARNKTKHVMLPEQASFDSAFFCRRG